MPAAAPAVPLPGTAAGATGVGAGAVLPRCLWRAVPPPFTRRMHPCRLGQEGRPSVLVSGLDGRGARSFTFFAEPDVHLSQMGAVLIDHALGSFGACERVV